MSTPAFVILISCFASIVLAEDFKTIEGKEYKNATVSRVEADGIVIKTKTGISKIYFTELPKDVQERFHYGSARGQAVTQRAGSATGQVVTQRAGSGTSDNTVTQRISGESHADRFAGFVEKKLDERESIMQGKHTPGPAELMMRRDFNFHWGFLAGIAIVAGLLFAIVWARVK